MVSRAASNRPPCFLYNTGPNHFHSSSVLICVHLWFRTRQSGWSDSNRRLRAPKARGIATSLHPAGAYLERKWTGRCSNPRLRCFKPPLYRLSYRSSISFQSGHKKKPDVFVTPGLMKGFPTYDRGVTSARDTGGNHSPLGRMYPVLAVRL